MPATPLQPPPTQPPSRLLPRLALLVATAGLAVTTLTACSSDGQAAAEAYKVGCPAVDAAVAGGSVVNQAAVKALQAARDSGQLDPEPTKWVDAAIGVLTSSDPKDVSIDARKLIVDGCSSHGYPLHNLK